MYKMLISGALLFSALCSHAQSIRLVAESGYRFENGAYVQTDTAELYYSFGRGAMPEESGSVFADWNWAADSISQWKFYNGQQTDYMRVHHQLDNNNRLAMAYWIMFYNSPWDTVQRQSFHYTNNKLDTVYYDRHDITWKPGSRKILVYDQYGLITELSQSYDTTLNQYINYVRYSYTHNTVGQQTEWLTENWVNNAWAFHQKFTYVYDGDNIDSTYAVYDPSLLFADNAIIDHTCDINGDNTESLNYIWNDNTNVFELKSKRIMTYNSNHDMLTDIIQNYTGGQFVNDYARTYTYNSFNLLEVSMRTSWDGTQFTPDQYDQKFINYYEEYDPASAASTVKQNPLLQVYPNPASNTINIQLLAPQDEIFGVTIYDVTGKSLKHWSEPPVSIYQKQIDVSALPAGNYFIRIGKQETVKFTLVK
jgi:hypothetical protein